MYSMAIVVNNTVLYTWKLLVEYTLNILPTKKEKWWSCHMLEMLANTMVVIILWYISVSN